MIEQVFPEGLKVVAEHKVRLPTYMNVSKKTRKALNLNVYRNLHHHSLNNQKQNFHEEVKKLLGGISKAQKIWIHYQIFAPTRGRLDTMNVGSIVDKYFSDTLVEAKLIEDDDYDHVVFNSFSFGGVCKMDGHAIATIFILEEEKPMRVLLDQDDIQIALENYVASLSLPSSNGVTISVDGDDIVAEVTFGETEESAPKKTTRKRRTPAKPKAKSEPEAEVTDEPTETAGEGSTDSADTAEAERTEDDSTNGEEAPKSKSSAKKGNLFGDEESQSSESAETTDSSVKKEAPDARSEEMKPKATKKSSIFDVG